mmetsp:Transcript_13398/g.31456  ORF Transcript_13398/g.31456 Transcript_13398/m.31456 type:complete len:475 (-) Transcript_13398:153-1577(-)
MATAPIPQHMAEKFKLDMAFFQQMIKEKPTVPQDLQDFDIYLMEQSVMPTLLQGLDALAKHVDKMTVAKTGGSSTAGKMDPDAIKRFNPLTWLAQYLLRNHPRQVKDHRQQAFATFRELASIERGRRHLLRQREHMDEVWQEMENELRESSEKMTISRMAEYVHRLDESWYLEGAFVKKMPVVFKGEVEPAAAGSDEVYFSAFWRWFEGYVVKNDVVRAETFMAASRKQAEAERVAKAEEEKQLAKAAAAKEVMEKKQRAEEEFERCSEAMQQSKEITDILAKQAVIDSLEQEEGSLPLEGEHIRLVRSMLAAWGYPVVCVAADSHSEAADAEDTDAEDAWSTAATRSWRRFAALYPKSAPLDIVDGDGLAKMLEKAAFMATLERRFRNHGEDAEEEDEEEEGTKGVMVTAVEMLDTGEAVVDAVTELGDVVQLVIPAEQVTEVEERLDASDGPVLARADLASGHVLELLPDRQ